MGAPVAMIVQMIIDDLMGVAVNAMSKQPRGWEGPGGGNPSGIQGSIGGEAAKAMSNAISGAADIYGSMRSKPQVTTKEETTLPTDTSNEPYNDEFSFGPPGYKFKDPNELMHYMMNGSDNQTINPFQNEPSNQFSSAYRW
jgi:hypothetical protein